MKPLTVILTGNRCKKEFRTRTAPDGKKNHVIGLILTQQIPSMYHFPLRVDLSAVTPFFRALT